MKVLKFGGTSVGSVESILSLKRIVEREAQRQPVVVVVSALGGITDQLLNTCLLYTSQRVTLAITKTLVIWPTAVLR